MNLMDNLAAEKKAAQSILSKGMDNITEKEQEELKQHYAEAKKLQERIDLFKEAGEGLDQLAGTSKTERKTVKAKTLGDFYVKSLQEKGLSVLATKGGLFSTPEFKASSSTHATGGAEPTLHSSPKPTRTAYGHTNVRSSSPTFSRPAP